MLTVASAKEGLLFLGFLINQRFSHRRMIKGFMLGEGLRSVNENACPPLEKTFDAKFRQYLLRYFTPLRARER